MDTTATYKVAGWGGIAWRITGFHKIRDEDYEWSGIEHEDESIVDAYMVGDDRIFLLDVDDLTKIDDDEYCPECGQIGCKAYG